MTRREWACRCARLVDGAHENPDCPLYPMHWSEIARHIVQLEDRLSSANERQS